MKALFDMLTHKLIVTDRVTGETSEFRWDFSKYKANAPKTWEAQALAVIELFVEKVSSRYVATEIVKV